MKILLITDEIWNDQVHGNNVLQNWFEGLEGIEIAQICCLPGKPFNSVCSRYFQLTDSMMMKSLLGRKAGINYEISLDEMNKKNKDEKNYIGSSPFYSFMKKISGPSVRVIREILWKVGRINKNQLKKFVEEFNPDIVFCPRLLTWKLMRIENIVRKYTKAPFVAFTADDEASFRELSFSPVFWLNRTFFNIAFRRHLKLYSHYFAMTELQAKEYAEKYNISTSWLPKCGDFENNQSTKEVGSPIRMVYAGRLYCNRWKSLGEIGKALKSINDDGVKIVLDIYTGDNLTAKQKKVLYEENYIFVHSRVSPEKLKDIYSKADIALHVESLDRKNRLRTRVSFSTKIIDLMASTCAIMVIAWSEHAGFKYLKEKDAAISISSYNEILSTLKTIIENNSLITRYQSKALDTGKKYHERSLIQAKFKYELNAIVSSFS